MHRVLYELEGKDGLRFSPYCWRTRMALIHKGIEVTTEPIPFTGKDLIAFSGQKLVPILVDGDTTVSDSWDIACYLDDTYKDGPQLFEGAEARGMAHFLNNWADQSLNVAILRLIILDIHANLEPADQEYFRETREKKLSMSLEDFQSGRDGNLKKLNAVLAPLRTTLKDQDFICGETPGYGDYIVFGSFQWARCSSPFKLLEKDDPVYQWRDRMLKLHDNYAGSALGFEV